MILETNTKSTNNKKSITVSADTYNRLVAIGKFSDRTFDHLVRRLLDDWEVWNRMHMQGVKE